MINLCFDKLIDDPDIKFVEGDWVFIYNKHANKYWPGLNSFDDFEIQPIEFQNACRAKKLDPESHKNRIGYRIVPYPNCTRHKGKINDDSWGEFSQIFPNTDYFRLVDYLYTENISFKIWRTGSAPDNSFYPIGINTYHLGFDYFSEISNAALQRLTDNKLQILFFYHEADNPYKIQDHLINLCSKHNIDKNLIYFISGNTAADEVENFCYFFDDEVLYQNSINPGEQIKFHREPREKKFTALVRIHKLWRAIFMSELWKSGLHNQGYFSYNQIVQSVEESDGLSSQPFDRSFTESKYRTIQDFLSDGPFKADELSDDNHNSFENIHKEHFENSYCNFVVETHFSLESKTGTTLTEKIVKPICHNQFFIVIAPPHTLKTLKNFGYKTFGRVIDESYDEIEDDQKRMEAVIDLCSSIAAMSFDELHNLYLELEPEITHNSKLFAESKKDRLVNLITKLEQ
jgi:hypothetical protein